MSQEREYVLGTHDEEIARLALQHRVWRPRALDAWRRAGFTVGQRLLDVGCGPGWASMDLAEIVGPTGRIDAIDRSRRFLDALEATRLERRLENITTHELDLDEADLPMHGADGAWSRWILSFVKRPRDLLARVAGAIRPGGVIVLHEYFEYSTWRFAPRLPDHDKFVRVVMESWRENGGEPDIGLDLAVWLGEMGFEMRTLQPIIDVLTPADYAWQWPKAFLDVGVRRLVDLGRLSEAGARSLSSAFAAAEAVPRTLMVTPAVLEIIAVRR